MLIVNNFDVYREGFIGRVRDPKTLNPLVTMYVVNWEEKVANVLAIARQNPSDARLAARKARVLHCGVPDPLSGRVILLCDVLGRMNSPVPRTCRH